MGHWKSAFCAVLVLVGCGRIGYGVGDASAPEDTLEPPVDTSITVDGMTATVTAVTDISLALQDTVVALPDRLPMAAASPAAVANGDSVFLSGGSRDSFGTSDCTRDVTKYQPDGTFSMFADELPVANQGMGLVHAEGALHSVMGFCGGSPDEERSVYRHPFVGSPPALLGMFPEGAYHLSTGLVPDAAGATTIITAGGFGSGPLRNFIQTMSMDGTGTMLTSTLPSHRCLGAGVSDGDAFFVIGGSTDTNCVPPGASPTLAMTDEIVRIRLRPSEAVDVAATLPAPVAAACATSLGDGTIGIFGGVEYVDDMAGGFARRATDRIVVFDPSTGEVTPHAATLPVPRSQMSCAHTSDGRTLLFGGANDDGTVTDEVLLFAPYASEGIESGVFDSGRVGADWDSLTVVEVVPAGTTVTYAVRTTEDLGSPGAWIEVTPGPLPAEVLDGRYLEWRVTLATTLPSVTPRVDRLEASFSF